MGLFTVALQVDFQQPTQNNIKGLGSLEKPPLLSCFRSRRCGKNERFPSNCAHRFGGRQKLKPVPSDSCLRAKQDNPSVWPFVWCVRNAPEPPSFAHLIDITVHLSLRHHILFWGRKEKTKPLSSGTQDLVGAQGSPPCLLSPPYPTQPTTLISGNETRRLESSWKNCWVGLLTTILVENPVESEMLRIRSNRGN